MDEHRNPPPLPPPGPIPYAVPTNRLASGNSVVGKFFLGALLGVLVSALVWILGWTPITSNGVLPFLLFPILKFILGLAFVFVPRWRALGAGILASMAIGLLIFGGMVVRSAANAVSNMPSTGLSSLCSTIPTSPSYSPTTQPGDSTTEPSNATTEPGAGATTEPVSNAP